MENYRYHWVDLPGIPPTLCTLDTCRRDYLEVSSDWTCTGRIQASRYPSFIDLAQGKVYNTALLPGKIIPLITPLGQPDHRMFTTKRLMIRKFLEGDLIPLIDLFSSDETIRYIGPRRAMSATETADWLRNQMEAQESGLTRYAIALKYSDELIGVCGFQKIDGVWDFGYYFRRPFWGNGYATEACMLLLKHAGTLLKGDEFCVFVAEKNEASHKVMERCGWCKGHNGAKGGKDGYYYVKGHQTSNVDGVTGI